MMEIIMKTIGKTRLSAALVAGVITISQAFPAAANRLVDQINEMTMEERVTLMTLTVSSAGYSCTSTGYFFKGIDQQDGAGYYGVLCDSGTHYMVSFPRNPDASSRVVECSLLATLQIDCFSEKF